MDEDLVPECLRQSPQQCREIQIAQRVPIDWALPLYGFLMPLIVAITILTNSFIVIVLSHRSLRTPTNFVLGAMAISELLTGLLCLPWLLYYYTFGGYAVDVREGLPAFWCTLFPYLATILPSIFHTAAIWLTVYLAVQRYIYICLPKMVRSQCTVKRSKQVIVSICVLSVWIYAPELFASYNQSFRVHDPITNRTRSICLMSRTALIQMVGNNLYHLLLYGIHTILVHTLPAVLLVFFTWKLIIAIREADKKHSSLLGKTQQQCKFAISSDEANGGVTPFLARCSVDEEALSCLSQNKAPTVGLHQQQKERERSSISESKRVQGLRQNTRMLLAVILLFLLTEIPAALIFSLHVGTVALKLPFGQKHYEVINKLLIFRNVLIVVSYPLRFAIYCGMSAQFREVVQQMLAKRRSLFSHSSYGILPTKGGSTSKTTGIAGSDGEGSSGSPSEKRASLAVHRGESIIWRNGCGAVAKDASVVGVRPSPSNSAGAPPIVLTREEEEGEDVERGKEEEWLEDEEEEDELSECRL